MRRVQNLDKSHGGEEIGLGAYWTNLKTFNGEVGMESWIASLVGSPQPLSVAVKKRTEKAFIDAKNKECRYQ